ncbi:MAG: helix-turn-helix transcriptional regulator [Eubacterium sp.]|nr:helix-turn-helix transcriptional regulator [Eubacterium sp.]
MQADLSNIENGRANPSLTVLIRIANILECSA